MSDGEDGDRRRKQEEYRFFRDVREAVIPHEASSPSSSDSSSSGGHREKRRRVDEGMSLSQQYAFVVLSNLNEFQATLRFIVVTI